MTRTILLLLVLATAAMLSCGGEAGKPTQTVTATKTVTPPAGEGSPTAVTAAIPTATATSPAPVTPTPSPATAPRPTLPPGIPVLPPGGSGAAADLQAQPECGGGQPDSVVARLTWTPAASPGSEQRVALSLSATGFDIGAFDISGPLPPDQSSYVWEDVKGQAVHFWRVLTLHAEGWAPSETANFEGPVCVSDGAP